MNNNAKIITAFIFGAVIGAAIAFRYTVKKMDCEYDEIFDEEACEERNEDSIVAITDDKRNAADQAKNKRDITEYASKLREESYITDNSDEPEDIKTTDTPYIISPDEFGEEGYETVSLTYYSDNVLVDDYDEVVDDINEVVGKDFAVYFKEHEDDSVYVRNDSKKCDYEILRDYETYFDS